MTALIWSFSPWLAFLVATRVASLTWSVGAGLVVALVVLVRAVGRHRVHLLDVAGTVYFLALGALLVLVHPGHLDTWGRYAQAGSHAALTLIVFGSIAVGRPFTEAYARETTPSELWTTPRFRAVNRQISAVWGVAFLVGTLALVAAGSVDSRQVLLRVVVPFGALFYAYTYTLKRTADTRKARPVVG